MPTNLASKGGEVFLSLRVSSTLMILMILALMIEHRGIISQTWHAKECIRVQEEFLHCQVGFKGQCLKSLQLKLWGQNSTLQAWRYPLAGETIVTRLLLLG